MTHAFELKQIELQCWKNYFTIFLPQEASRAFGNNTEKEPQKPRPKLKKYVHYIFTEDNCSTCNLMQVVVFGKNVSILLNNDSKFLALKVEN